MIDFKNSSGCIRGVLLLLLLFLSNRAFVSAENVPNDALISADAYTPVSRSHSDGINYDNFEVPIQNEGFYVPSFWVCPSKHNDGTYTRYVVYVNNEYAGEILPHKSNWQSVVLPYPGSLKLREGVNVISIGTVSPEMASCEQLKLMCEANSLSESLDADLYDSFVECAKMGILPVDDEDGIDIFQEEPAALYGIAPPSQYLASATLLYSFYRLFNWVEGQVVTLSSKSDVEHDIDMCLFMAHSPTTHKFDFVDADMAQCINWKCVSERDEQLNKETIERSIRIPKTGGYLVRVRSRQNRVLGVADVSINGTTYEDCPIYYWEFKGFDPYLTTIPYEFYLVSQSSESKPMICVDGNFVDRVVTVGMTCPDEMIESAGFKKSDAYVRRQFRISPTHLSISEGSSLHPLAKATLTVRKYKENNVYNVASFIDSHQETSLLEYDSDLEVCYSDNQLSIKGGDPWTSVGLSDVYGHTVWKSANGHAFYNLSEIRSGVYTLYVMNDGKMVKSDKIVIK